MLNNQQKEIRNKCCFLLGLMIQDRIITLLSRKILLFILLSVLRSKLQIRIIYTEAIFFFFVYPNEEAHQIGGCKNSHSYYC